MRKKSISFILVFVLTATLAVPAFADEETESMLDVNSLDSLDALDDLDDSTLEQIEEMGEKANISIEDMEDEIENDVEDDAVSYNDLLNAIQTSTLSDGALSLSDCLSSIGAIDTTFDEMYSLASSGIESDNIDMGLLNYSYGSLSDSLLDTYDSIDLSGASVGCMQLFSDTYGDVLNSINFQTASIPDGFDINAMFNSASSSINDAYGTAISSGTFESIKSSISIGDIFAQAAAGPTTTSLAIADSSLSWFDEQTASSDSLMKGQYDEASKDFKSNYESYDAAAKSMAELSDYLNNSGDHMMSIDESGNIDLNYTVIEDNMNTALQYSWGDSPEEDAETVDEYHDEILSEYTDYLENKTHPLETLFTFIGTGNFGKLLSDDKDAAFEEVAEDAMEKYKNNDSNWTSWVRGDRGFSKLIDPLYAGLDRIVDEHQ